MFGLKLSGADHSDEQQLARLARKIAASMTHSWQIMEVSGELTSTMLRHDLFRYLPPDLTIVHGPGCAVASVPVHIYDRAISIAQEPDVIFCATAELLRIPGSTKDLLEVKAQGFDVRVVYSSIECIGIARSNPDKKVVLFNVGFESSVQMDALAVWQARRLGVSNFYLLSDHANLPPVVSRVLADRDSQVNAVLVPGQLACISGFEDYEPIAETMRRPIVVTGFEPTDILEGILKAVNLLEYGKAAVENQYKRAANRQGNLEVRALISEVFEVCQREWRGLGVVPAGGYALKPEFSAFDAHQVFAPLGACDIEGTGCISSEIWLGLKSPLQCPLFGKTCKPDSPQGATMVSTAGTCAAYFKHQFKK
ncbi:MAG: hydrogenase formation protein HypD [Candidatus Obscuribacter phosphatis]|uniref:Hydrogenase formation protein HypD n=1 Tax=Candidatus Obscuribacter phosphatis TaxID=1906157 RepID=A0A8J7TLV3_9BACT|nr:hydrogenase formation protein HypD [Candidatus Obscuribacter phosphatis]